MPWRLKIYLTAVTGGGVTSHVHTDDGSGTGWLPTLVADVPDFESTETYLEAGAWTLTSTGYKTFNIADAHIPAGTLQIKLVDNAENTTNVRNCTLASQNNATVAFRPVMEWYEESSKPTRTMMGVGL